MRLRSWFPVVLALTSFGCGMKRNLTGPQPDAQSSTPIAASLAASPIAPGAVYTMTNGAAGNAVLAFPRTADGELSGPRSFSTGGVGTGGGLGNQSGLALSQGNRWLFAVNAGSNDVSVFRTSSQGLTLTDRASSGGVRPISLATHGDLLYVLNAGGSGNVQGLRVSSAGALEAIAGSSRPLSNAAANPAQIGLSPDGQHLVVTEKGTNLLSVYEVSSDGSLTGPVTTPSSGTTPFGFGFDNRGTLVVSEAFGGGAGASAVSSYRVERDGSVNLVSGSKATTQTAACWIAVSDNNHFAYAANAGSASITGYSIGSDGSLARLDTGVTASTGAGPSELAFSAGSRFLYVLNGTDHSIGGYAVSANGGLEPLPATPGLVAGSNGLAAR